MTIREPAPGVSDDIVLAVDDGSTRVAAAIAVSAGGRLRRLTIERNGSHVDVLAPSPVDAAAASTGWGSFPMAPWAGRLRHGRFRHGGERIGLDVNHSDGDAAGGPGTGGRAITPPLPAVDGPITDDCERQHAIHGTTFARAWTVDELGDTTCTMSCALTGALGWPFPGVARQGLRLSSDRLELELVIEAGEGASFPASMGWHPWFAKPDRLEFRPLRMYRTDGIGLPTGALTEPTASPWDDCFINHEPVRLHYAREVAPIITVTADVDHWVIYDKPAHATCVEPQSGPPDALNLGPEIVTDRHPLRHVMTIGW